MQHEDEDDTATDACSPDRDGDDDEGDVTDLQASQVITEVDVRRGLVDEVELLRARC